MKQSDTRLIQADARASFVSGYLQCFLLPMTKDLLPLY